MHVVDSDVDADADADFIDNANSDGDSDVSSGDIDHGHGHGRYYRSSIILSIHGCEKERISSPSDLEWTHNADDTSLWTDTANILSGTCPKNNPFATKAVYEYVNDAGDSRAVAESSDSVETLSSSLCVMAVQTDFSLSLLTS